jgi:glycosyltransferase involved in cell wall biosynthesis
VRVLHVVPSTHGRGGDIFALDLAQALRTDGPEQLVVALRPGARNIGTVLTLTTTHRRIPGLNIDPAGLHRLRSVVRSWRPDIIQSHGGEVLKYLIGHGTTPIVYRRIGMSPRWLRGPRRMAYRALMLRTDRIVAVADAIRRETVERFGIHPSRVIHIPNAIAMSRLNRSRDGTGVKRELGIPMEAPVVLSVGALAWEKDPVGLLHVASVVLSRNTTSYYVAAGDGPLRSRLEDAASRLGVRHRVRVLGWRPDVADLMAMASCFLFASRSDGMEGLPAVLIEAGLSGLPVVATDVAGTSEVIIDGSTGFLVPDGAGARLVECTLRLINDQELRRRMAHEAQNRCREQFTIEPIAARYMALYEEVLVERHRTDHAAAKR